MTTKTAQFTPGPWNVRHYRVAPTNCQWSDVTDSTGGLITHVPSSKGNAALIAAAPAMYAAGQLSLGVLVQVAAELERTGNEELRSIVRSAIIEQKTALAQAEGAHHE